MSSAGQPPKGSGTTTEGKIAHIHQNLSKSTHRSHSANSLENQQSDENGPGELSLADVLELCPAAVWISDAQGNTTYTNRHWQQYCGQPPEESRSECWISRVHPEDQTSVAALMHEVQSRACEREIRLRRSGGEYRWHVLKGVSLNRENGEAGHWLGVSIDIHDRKMAQVAVSEAEEHMRFTLEAAGVGSCGFYPCSEKKEWSGRSADMLGVPREVEPKLEIFMSRVHPEDKQRVWETVGALLQSPVTGEYDFDYRIVRPDGEVRWLLSRGKYFVPSADSGQEPRMKGILLDITERKQAEEEKKRLEEQLVLAQKMEAIGRLASGVAHDFNNLITVIAGAAERLQQKFGDHRSAQELVKIIEEATDHASGLTGQLLAFGRRQVLHPVALCLKDVLERPNGMLRRMVSENIALEVQLGEGLWSVKLDPIQFDQILLNLAANARDAMPHGGTITITTTNCTLTAGENGAPDTLNPGEYVCLGFADTGVGMDAETLSHLFEPFYTTKEFGHGTGLGLATVYGIVQQSGGHICVRSAPGQGTEFIIYLPRTAETRQPALKSSSHEREHQLCQGPSLAPNILLVEDEPRLREILAEHLCDRGYQVHQAANAREAEDLASRHNIGLLITDLVMPGEGGVSVAQSLAKAHPGLRTIFISGYAEDEALHEALQQPNVYYLQKPFRALSLLAKVKEALSNGETA